MIIIAHRGLLAGPDSTLENLPVQINKAIAADYRAEVDVWKIGDIFYLSHDEPTDYNNLDPSRIVNVDFFRERSDKLYIHCKNIEALEYFTEINEKLTIFTCFWHQNDDYTLTSQSEIWAYPNYNVTAKYSRNAICVKPELADSDFTCDNFNAICTAYADDYNFLYNESDV